MDSYLKSQLASWPLAAANYAALADVETKTLDNGMRVQYNPARMVSTGAKMDAATLANRPCFLCRANRPQQQLHRDWGDYEILVNPFPIFPRHFTIPLRSHEPQRISGRVADMARLALEMPGYTVFYNGPRCGASAPDHMHFQAGNSDFLPLWQQLGPRPGGISAATVFGTLNVITLSADTPEAAAALFDKVYRALPPAEGEPMLNLLMRADGTGITAVVIPRRAHRPDFYGTGEGQMVVSPASVDLAGVMVTPRHEDFIKIDTETINRIFKQLCMTKQEIDDICLRAEALTGEPMVSVGVLTEEKLQFTLHGSYMLDGDTVTGAVEIKAKGFKEPLVFLPVDDECYTEVKDVVIGVNFHWQRREVQCFKGIIKIIPDGDMITLVNILPVEDYLTSVISSEMSATSQLELLKAHAVISRSWVLAQIRRQRGYKPESARPDNTDAVDHSLCRKRIVWYDHDDHTLFDVCADDHCQRYQGITRASTQAVRDAIEATRGEVITADGELCDARFSKCCGGVFEEFESCWDDTHKSYLVARRDSARPADFPDLTVEENAVEWIMSAPEAFCNTHDTAILGQVLNNYDQETTDFYRWTVEYDDDTLADLVKRRTGVDFGRIKALVPLKRGTSGRIIVLRIVGEKLTMDIGKELEIRRALSESHLYSSAFVVERTPAGFRLRGAGWGHGVGLCQIGAAVMAAEGSDYRSILAHYYPGSEITQNYLNDQPQ